MALPIKSAAQLEATWTHWFLYGDTGTGKTIAASTFPKPLFIVPANESSVTTLIGQDFDYVEVQSVTSKAGKLGMVEVINELHLMYGRDPDSFYETIVVESLSHYSDLIVEELSNGGKKPMEFQEWGQVNNHFRHIQTVLRMMQVNAVFTSLASVVKADRKKEKSGESKPMISGSASYKMPSSCDVIGYTECIPGQPPRYRVHFQEYKGFAARTRFSAMPRVVENFTYAEIRPFLRGRDVQQGGGEKGE